MASILRKRKIIDGPYGSSPSQPSIASFGRISKSNQGHPSKKNRKAQPTQPEQSPSVTLKENKKRKLQHAPELPEERPLGVRNLNVEGKATKAQKPKPARLGPSLPDTPIGERRIAPLKSKAKVTESPTQGARAILEAFVIAAPAPKYEARGNTQRVKDTTSLEQSTPLESTATFPPEFQELIELHSAFLSALSLHYAHNGTSSPAILAELRPSIERTWGKRRVEPGDIQRLLGIQQLKPYQSTKLPTLSIVDFGRSKLGIEFSSDHTSESFSSPLPVNSLASIFKKNLKHLLPISPDSTTLPLAPITPFTPVKSSGPSKGAQRLSDIRATAILAQAANAVSDGTAAPPPTSSQQQSPTTHSKPANRGASLLERIKAKEAHAASLPAGPTAEQVARRAALMRLEEIIPVIESLTYQSSGSSSGAGAASRGMGMSSAASDLAAALGMGSGRGMGMLAPVQKTVSFTMGTLAQRLQMSLKHPISVEEAGRSIVLLAKEVMPAWVQVREIGKLKSVSVRGSVGRQEWVSRLRELVDEA